MQDITDKHLVGDKFSDREVFLKIWTSPRQVFKFINEIGYDKFVIPLLVLSGISRSFDRADVKDMGDRYSLWTIVGLCIVLGGLFGWMSLYFYAALVNWTGKWLKAQGNTNSILTMFSYAMIPEIVALILLIPQILIYGNDFFRSYDYTLHLNATSNVVFYIAVTLEFILGVWTAFLCVIGTSEIQKLSIGQAILNLLLPILVIAVPIFIIALLFKLLN